MGEIPVRKAIAFQLSNLNGLCSREGYLIEVFLIRIALKGFIPFSSVVYGRGNIYSDFMGSGILNPF